MSPQLTVMPRRAVLGLAFTLASPRILRAQDAIRITDLLGREVVLPRAPRRIVLGQGRLLSLMGLLHPDPVSLLAGRADDMRIVLPDENAAWERRFPDLAKLPLVGRQITTDLSLETLAMLNPDLVILNRLNVGPLDGRGRSEVLDKVASLGIPVAVIDCMASPLTETLPSIGILGALIGRQQQAAALGAFYSERMAAVRDWFARHRPPVVPVMLHNHGGGRECCFSIATTSFADLLVLVGGHSIAADLLRRPLGQLHKEFVLTHPWDAYVTTGGVYNGRGGVSLGAGVAPDAASRSLAAMLTAQALGSIPAIRAGRAWGIWHGFNETPLHTVALEAMAGWLHPESRAVFDPQRTLDIVNSRFAVVPSEGTYWTGLPA